MMLSILASQTADTKLGPIELAGSKLWEGPALNAHVGCFRVPFDTYASLRGWDDAPQGVDQSKFWTFFEIEKLIRMALRQSVAAFEVLCCSTEQALELRSEILSSSATQQLCVNLLESAQGSLLRGEKGRAHILCHSGLALHHHGVASIEASALADTLSGQYVKPEMFGASDIEHALQTLGTPSKLPARPSDYDGLCTRLINIRKQTAIL